MPSYKNEKQYIKEKHTDREIGGWYERTGYRPILLQVIFTAYWTLFGKACQDKATKGEDRSDYITEYQ